MWRKLWEFITAAITLARDIEETRAELKELRQEFHQMSLVVVQLQAQLTTLAQHEQAEREKLLLQIRLEQKHLPPADEK